MDRHVTSAQWGVFTQVSIVACRETLAKCGTEWAPGSVGISRRDDGLFVGVYLQAKLRLEEAQRRTVFGHIDRLVAVMMGVASGGQHRR